MLNRYRARQATEREILSLRPWALPIATIQSNLILIALFTHTICPKLALVDTSLSELDKNCTASDAGYLPHENPVMRTAPPGLKATLRLADTGRSKRTGSSKPLVLLHRHLMSNKMVDDQAAANLAARQDAAQRAIRCLRDMELGGAEDALLWAYGRRSGPSRWCFCNCDLLCRVRLILAKLGNLNLATLNWPGKDPQGQRAVKMLSSTIRPHRLCRRG